MAGFGRLDLVSANAGIQTQTAPAEDVEEDIWRNMIDTNLAGCVACSPGRVAIPHLMAGGRGGWIILTSSAASLRAYANIGHYVSAKHGVVGPMRTLALELALDFIRVKSVHPRTWILR